MRRILWMAGAIALLTAASARGQEARFDVYATSYDAAGNEVGWQQMDCSGRVSGGGVFPADHWTVMRSRCPNTERVAQWADGSGSTNTYGPMESGFGIYGTPGGDWFWNCQYTCSWVPTNDGWTPKCTTVCF